MIFASAISSSADAMAGVDKLVSVVTGRVSPSRGDLLLYFATPHFEDDLDDIIPKLTDAYPDATLIGCTAEGTIGANREVERAPSMSLLVASMPGVEIRSFTLTQGQLQTATGQAAWESLVGVSKESSPVFVACGDPFSIDVQSFVDGVNEAFPQAFLFGGIASAAEAPGQNRLIFDDAILEEGIVGVALTGNLTVQGVVSQGCRPIGKPFVVTKASSNVIHELGGRPSLAQLQSVYSRLGPHEERLVRQALLIGQAIDEYKDSLQLGDFLIHNIVGADHNSGAIAIAGPARVGTTVQFHVRDADCADADLRQLLATRVADSGQKPIAGAMFFGCNGRGSRMWPESNHEINVLHEIVGDIPTAGFFCAGEFGPIGGKNFIHAFTASIALFRPASTN